MFQALKFQRTHKKLEWFTKCQSKSLFKHWERKLLWKKKFFAIFWPFDVHVNKQKCQFKLDTESSSLRIKQNSVLKKIEPTHFIQWTLNNQGIFSMPWCSGYVGRSVASFTRDPRFKSHEQNQWKILYQV